MSSLRKTISAGVSTGVAVIALSLIASAPAASGRSVHARPFLTDGTSHVVQTVDHGRSVVVRHVAGGIHSTSTLRLRPERLPARKGRSGASGGRDEPSRTACARRREPRGTYRAIVAESGSGRDSAEEALCAFRTARRRRRSSAVHAHRARGVGRGDRRQPGRPLARQGLHRQGRQGGGDRRRLQGPARAPGCR